jgi:type IV secretory pathway VirB6-like protein
MKPMTHCRRRPQYVLLALPLGLLLALPACSVVSAAGTAVGAAASVAGAAVSTSASVAGTAASATASAVGSAVKTAAGSGKPEAPANAAKP